MLTPMKHSDALDLFTQALIKAKEVEKNQSVTGVQVFELEYSISKIKIRIERLVKHSSEGMIYLEDCDFELLEWFGNE